MCRNEDGAEGEVGPLDGEFWKASEAVEVAGNAPSGETGVDVLRTRSFSPRSTRGQVIWHATNRFSF